MDTKIERYIKEGKLLPISINAPLKRSYWKEEYIGQSLPFTELGVSPESLDTYKSYVEDIPTEKKSAKMLAAAIIIYHKIQAENREIISFRKHAKLLVDNYLKPQKQVFISEEAQRIQNLSQVSTLLIYYRYVKKCILEAGTRESSQRRDL